MTEAASPPLCHRTRWVICALLFCATAINYIDRIGARAGYALAMGLWTLAHMAHALAHSLGGFMLSPRYEPAVPA